MDGGEIFVVDDDLTILSAIGYILRRVGLNVRTFGHADALLGQVSDNPPASVLLDV